MLIPPLFWFPPYFNLKKEIIFVSFLKRINYVFVCYYEEVSIENVQRYYPQRNFYLECSEILPPPPPPRPNHAGVLLQTGFWSHALMPNTVLFFFKTRNVSNILSFKFLIRYMVYRVFNSTYTYWTFSLWLFGWLLKPSSQISQSYSQMLRFCLLPVNN